MCLETFYIRYACIVSLLCQFVTFIELAFLLTYERKQIQFKKS